MRPTFPAVKLVGIFRKRQGVGRYSFIDPEREQEELVPRTALLEDHTNVGGSHVQDSRRDHRR